MHMKRRNVIALAASAAALAYQPSWGQARAPLLMDGKKTLYQRILTRPGAVVGAKPGAAGNKPLLPFSVFYVYERVVDGGKPYLLVGAGSDGKTAGYLAETDTVPWRHAITLSFATPTNRPRVLFFRDKESVTSFVKSADAAAQTDKVLKEFAANKALAPSSVVVAAEPEKFIDPAKEFYLFPVLEASVTSSIGSATTRLVKVASITRDAAPAPAAPQGAAGIANYNAAVVFVIDATSSMQPYIDRVREAMEQVLKRADEAKLTSRIRFGLVAFQDDPAKTKGVEYLSKVFADPNVITSREQFMAATQKLQATKSSTRAYAEDGYAALDMALQKINWRNFGGRYVVYISDASAREGTSPLASTKMSTKEVRDFAQERSVAIYTMHLRTPEGKNDHAVAEAQFKRLSAWPGAGSFYFPVEAGDPAKFGAGVKQIADALVEQVRAPEKLLDAKPKSANAVDAGLDASGRAMVLAYLGRQEGTKAPPMYEAWASERSVGADRTVPALTVRVLLTKNQLSDLQTLLRRLIEADDKRIIDPTTFFNQLRSAAVAMGRDPSKVGQGKALNLSDAGLMGEYLEGLPFNSRVMALSLDSWANMQTQESVAITDGLRSKIALYQRFHDDPASWIKLHPDANDSDRVYPVPMDALP